MDVEAAEDVAFDEAELRPDVERVLSEHLKDAPYDESKVDSLVNVICEDVMQLCTEKRKPFKYTVTAVIMQNTGAGMSTECAAFCDVMNDGFMVTRFPDKTTTKDFHMACVVTIFAFAL